jgi:beta-N-acetylhexosaminidase
MTAQSVLLPGFTGPTLPSWLAARLRNGLGGVCLFATNIETREQLRELTQAIREANPFALIAIDEEGGDVTRLYSDQGSPYPGNALLGRIDDPEFTKFVATIVGWELRRAGVNLNLAPDVDINSNPDNPVIGTRSFGADPGLVARHASAWIEGLQLTGVSASAKHFPGHGDTAEDSHLALPVVDVDRATLDVRELVPFAAAVAAGTRTVMTSHILLPQLDDGRPATFSPGILQDLLRRDLEFDGVIVTDALDMAGASRDVGIPAAAVLALAAGSDLLCIGTDNTDAELQSIEAEIDAAVLDGRLDASRLADAAARIKTLAATLLIEQDDIPIPEWIVANAEPEFELGRAIAAFEFRSDVVAPERFRLVSIETTANIAVGGSPWGLAAAGEPVTFVHEGDGLPDGALDEAGAVVTLVFVGKDNHRRPWVRDLIDLARRQHPSTLVIDMGWPSDDRRYADVATFGASRYVGTALAAWLRKADAK